MGGASLGRMPVRLAPVGGRGVGGSAAAWAWLSVQHGGCTGRLCRKHSRAAGCNQGPQCLWIITAL